MPEIATVLARKVSIFLCPSDSFPDGSHPGNNYRFNIGSDARGESGPFGQLRYQRPSGITDGLSYTVGASEKHVGSWGKVFVSSRDLLFLQAKDSINPPWPSTDEWLIDCRNKPPNAVFFTGVGQTWFIDGGAFTTYNHVAPPNSEVVDCARDMGWPYTIGTTPARSRHVGAVHVAFLDGSVRAATSEIDLGVWRALGTCAGGEVVPSGGF